MKQRAETPKINSLCAVSLRQNLRGSVLGHSWYRENIFLTTFYLFREAEISKFDESFPVYHDVFWLEVSIDDVLWMQVVECEHYLRDIELSLLLWKLLFYGQQVVQLTTWTILENEIKLLLALEGGHHSNNKGVIEFNKYISLGENVFEFVLFLN